MTMRSTVRLMSVVVCEENGPERVSTSLDHVFWQMCSENTVAVLL
jgi:hypothetical protein